MAVNRSTVVDDDDDRSDWIELFNPSGTSVNLKGWALTDDPTHQTKWRFPNVTLGSREYRVVFASGKNRKVLNAPLHTDFRLSREAGYLALLDAGGKVAYEFAPKYPKQFDDVCVVSALFLIWLRSAYRFRRSKPRVILRQNSEHLR